MLGIMQVAAGVGIVLLVVVLLLAAMLVGIFAFSPTRSEGSPGAKASPRDLPRRVRVAKGSTGQT